jgi:bacillithiol biosynthesis cysteine-adding enzyme BshC
MPTVKDIPFRNIPLQSALFLDYLNLSPAALRFYHQAPDPESLKNSYPGRLADLGFARTRIASILHRQNERQGGDPATLRRIEELEKPDSVAVLTGQQVGLFGGPLYTIYKAVTAIRMADELRRCGIPAAAVFWMEGEDHDLAEVTHCTVCPPSAGTHRIDYRGMLFGNSDMPPRSVGSLPFPESITKAVRDYTSYMADTRWKPEVQGLLESAYRPGTTFTGAFAHVLARIFRGTGLILFDPQEPDAKRLASKVFQETLRNADDIHDALVGRSRELEAAGYHSQVRIPENSTVLFLFVGQERRALERRNSGFGVKNDDRVFSPEEMLAIAEETPDRFSPNVLLRPLIQDHLFPTIAYVAGSSELAYFAQIEILYRQFGRPMPAIWPRNSFTLIEPEAASAMEKLEIEFQDCFSGKQYLIEKAMRNSASSKAIAAVDQLEERLDRALAEIAPEVRAVEAPLAKALGTARRKMLHNIGKLRSGIIRHEAAQSASVMSAIELLLDRCYPNQNLQERELSIHHFLAGRGPSALEAVGAAADIGNFAHRLLWLE